MAPYIHHIDLGIREKIKQLVEVVALCLGAGKKYNTSHH